MSASSIPSADRPQTPSMAVPRRAPSPLDVNGAERLQSGADVSISKPTGTIKGPLRITYPGSLSSRLATLKTEAKAASFNQPLNVGRVHVEQDAADKSPQSNAAAEGPLLSHANRLLQELAIAIDRGGLASPPQQQSLNLPPAASDDGLASHLHIQALVQAFHKRQRQANTLVAVGLLVALVMTLGGLALLISVSNTLPFEGPCCGHASESSSPTIIPMNADMTAAPREGRD